MAETLNFIDRDSAEEGTREREDQYRTVLEAVKDGIIFSDESGHFWVFNSEMEKLTGYSMKEANACSDFNLLLYPDPKDREQALDGLNNLVKPGDTYETETIIQTKNGTKKNILVSTTLVLYKDRRMFLSTYHDITERKQAEEVLKSERDKLQVLMDGLARTEVGINIIGADYKVLFQNQTLKERFSDLTGKICYENYMGLKKPCDFCPMTKSMETNKVEHVELTGVDGRNYEVFSAPFPNPNGTVDKTIEIILDITDRKKAEEELQRSMKRYRELYEGSRDGYIMMNMDDKIIEYNSSFKKMVGYTDEELHKKTCNNITPQEWHPVEDTIIKEHVLKRGYSDIYEKEFIRKDGKIISVELRRNLLKENEKPIGMWSFVRDITDRKQTETELMKKIKDLEKYKNITVGRELRIIELKKKVKQLEELKRKLSEGK